MRNIQRGIAIAKSGQAIYHKMRGKRYSFPRKVQYRAAYRYRPNYQRGKGWKKELKFFDKKLGTVAIPTTGSFQTLNIDIPEGTGQSQRIGRSINIRKINIRGIGYIAEQTAKESASDVIRIMLVQDKQANKALFAGTDLLSASAILEYMNLANSGRFKVLATRQIEVRSHAGGGNGTSNVFADDHVWFNINLNVSIPIEYSGTAGTIGTVTTNNLVLCAWSHDGKGAWNWICRLRYEG